MERPTGDGSRGRSSPCGSLGRFAPFGRAIHTATSTRESLDGWVLCPATRDPDEPRRVEAADGLEVDEDDDSDSWLARSSSAR